MAITQVISAIPDAGHRGIDTRDTFVTKQEAFQDALTATTVTQLNTAISQINETETNMNTIKQETIDAKNDAITAKYEAELARDEVVGAASSLPDGIINDATISPTDTWSSQKINGLFFKYMTKTTNYTAFNNDFIYADTSDGSFTLTLPLAPSTNTLVGVLDNTGSFETNNLTIARNGGTIMGLAEDMIVDVKNISFELIFNGSDWRIK